MKALYTRIISVLLTLALIGGLFGLLPSKTAADSLDTASTAVQEGVYPELPIASQANYIIYKEGYRNNRIELV